MFILLLFYYWLQVSTLKGHHYPNIYKKNPHVSATYTRSTKH